MTWLIVAGCAAYAAALVFVGLTMAEMTRADINMEGDPANRMPDELTGYGEADGLGRQVHGVAVHGQSYGLDEGARS